MAAHHSRNLLALVAVLLVTAGAPSAASAAVPGWMTPTAGTQAYFGIGGTETACPTFDRFVQWLQSMQPDKSKLCPKEKAPQRVTVVSWKSNPLGPGAPIVEVRFPDRKSAWALAVAPVVPAGALALIGDNNCSAELARDHVKHVTIKSWRELCKAAVVKQILSSRANLLQMKFVGSGKTFQTAAATAFLPEPLQPSGDPRYNLAFFISPR